MFQSPMRNTRTGIRHVQKWVSASTPSIDRLWIGEDGCICVTVSIRMNIPLLETSTPTPSTPSGTGLSD